MALKSSKGQLLDLIGLSEWISRPKVKDVADVTGVPGRYFKTLLESYVSDHAKIEVGPAYATFPDLSILSGSETIELADLALSATLITPILEQISAEKQGRLNAPEGPCLDQNMIVPLLLFWDARCALPLDHVTFSLIDDLAFVATRFGIKIDRSKGERACSHRPGPSTPLYASDMIRCDASRKPT